MKSQILAESVKVFELRWINTHGPPDIVSIDIEFFKMPFKNALGYFGTRVEPRSAHRNNKFGFIMRKNVVMRLIVRRVLKNA